MSSRRFVPPPSNLDRMGADYQDWITEQGNPNDDYGDPIEEYADDEDDEPPYACVNCADRGCSQCMPWCSQCGETLHTKKEKTRKLCKLCTQQARWTYVLNHPWTCPHCGRHHRDPLNQHFGLCRRCQVVTGKVAFKGDLNCIGGCGTVCDDLSILSDEEIEYGFFECSDCLRQSLQKIIESAQAHNQTPGNPQA